MPTTPTILRRNWGFGFPIALAACLAGCVVATIEPVIPESEATFEPGLVGTWRETSGSDLVQVARSGPSGYSIRHTSGEQVYGYGGRTGRLGDRLVLEIWRTPGNGDARMSDGALLIPAHQMLALDLHGDRAETAFLELDTLRAALRAGKFKLSYLPRGDDLLLTGTTGELRDALREHIARPGAFGERTVWRRLAGHGAGTTRPAAPVPCFEDSAWPEADRLFRRDPRWVGADGAYSIPLAEGRTLWLFGDSWIDTTGRHARRGARMIRNSVAIQHGTDPSQSSIAFFWRRAADGTPASFFPEQEKHWFWPGHGIRLGEVVIVFLNRLLPSRHGLGFSPAGWDAVLIRNPDDEPPRWRLSWLRAPKNPLGVAIGSAGVVRRGQHLYAFSSLEPVSPHPIYLVRWRVEDVARGNLAKLEWWGGPDAGWLPDASPLARQPVFLDGQTELTVHYDDARREFLSFQTTGFGAADVAVRSAGEITGPWSDARALYRPPEFYRKNIMIYAGKAHPHLQGADLVLTYATNSFDFSEQFADSLLYYPRFVRLRRCSRE